MGSSRIFELKESFRFGGIKGTLGVVGVGNVDAVGLNRPFELTAVRLVGEVANAENAGEGGRGTRDGLLVSMASPSSVTTTVFERVLAPGTLIDGGRLLRILGDVGVGGNSEVGGGN